MKLKTCIDLFAGTGAFSKVLDQYGIKCVFANDMEKASETMFKTNHPDIPFCLQDLNTIDVAKQIPPHDILCGGFPCQPFSIAGKQKGFQDSRANVFWKIIDIIKLRNPQVILLENVKNLTTHDNKNTFKVICEELNKLHYHLNFQVFDTSKASTLPQHRERIYIVGFRDKACADAFFFDTTLYKNVPISSLLQVDVPEKYYYTNKLAVYDTVQADVKKHISTNTMYQYRRYYVRENKSNCCPTLTANMGSGGHNVPLLKDDKGIRKLTPRECFNLQGFPEEYILPHSELSDSALYKLAGNAVSLPVIDGIVKQVVQLCSS